MVRVIFFGNRQSTLSSKVFEFLAGTEARVVGVVDTPRGKSLTTTRQQEESIDFLQRAKERGIFCARPDNPNIRSFIEVCLSLHPDLFLAAGYTGIFKERILSVPSFAVVNVHASLLPKYRGKHPVFQALRNREKYTGLTIHHVTRGIDEGDIILQKAIPVKPGDTVSSLYARIMEYTGPLIHRLISLSEGGTLPRHLQSAKRASYYGSLTPNDYQVNWEEKAESIEALVRAAAGSAFIKMPAGNVYVDKVEVEPGQKRWAEPGKVILVSPHHVLVGARDTFVRIDTVRFEGGMLSFYDFCSSHNIKSVPGAPGIQEQKKQGGNQ